MRVEAEDEDHLGEYRGFMETIVAQERQRRT
jgi:hypothetical protein